MASSKIRAFVTVLTVMFLAACNPSDEPECASGSGQLHLQNPFSREFHIVISNGNDVVDELDVQKDATVNVDTPIGSFQISVVDKTTGKLLKELTVSVTCDSQTIVAIQPLPEPTSTPTPGPTPTPTPTPSVEPTPIPTPTPTSTPTPGMIVLATIPDSPVEANAVFTYQATSSSASSLTWSLAMAPVGMTITSQGRLNWTPSPTQVGTHQVTVQGTDPMSGASGTTSFKVFVNPRITLDRQSFSEGEAGDPLFTLSIEGNSSVASISSNELWTGFTPILADANGLTIRPKNFANHTFTFQPGSGSPTYLDVSGTAKFARSFELDFTVRFENGTEITKTFPITIHPTNLPYLRYDIFAASLDDGSVEGDDPIVLLNNVLEMHRLYQGWRTPILLRYRSGEIMCNGQPLTVFDTAVAGTKTCVSEKVSPDAETVFFFSASQAGQALNGGIALSLRHGVVASKYTWTHAMAHELAHNFGLAHTFDVIDNPTVAHMDTDGYFFRKIAQAARTEDTSTYWGDFINKVWIWNPIDFPMGSFDFNGISDDTPLDPYDTKMVTLYGLSWNNAPYVDGDRLLLNSGGPSGEVPCLQSTFYDGPTNSYPVNCTAETGLTVTPQLTANVMSYWLRPNGSSLFTTNQKLRMNRVLGTVPVLTVGGP